MIFTNAIKTKKIRNKQIREKRTTRNRVRDIVNDIHREKKNENFDVFVIRFAKTKIERNEIVRRQQKINDFENERHDFEKKKYFYILFICYISFSKNFFIFFNFEFLSFRISQHRRRNFFFSFYFDRFSNNIFDVIVNVDFHEITINNKKK